MTRQVPASIEAFIFRCLAKNPGLRPLNWDWIVAECARWFQQLTGASPRMEFNEDTLTLDELRSARSSLYQLRRYSELLEVCQRILEIDPGDIKSWHHKGVCLENLGRLEEALAAHEGGLAVNPDDAHGWQHKATVLEKSETPTKRAGSLGSHSGTRSAICICMEVQRLAADNHGKAARGVGLIRPCTCDPRDRQRLSRSRGSTRGNGTMGAAACRRGSRPANGAELRRCLESSRRCACKAEPQRGVAGRSREGHCLRSRQMNMRGAARREC